MPEWSKCRGGNCPARWTCERYIAPPGCDQNYQDFNSQRRNGESRCAFFKPVLPSAPAETDQVA